MEVDASKYRLRAFEQSFVKPVLSFLEADPSLERRTVDTVFWNAVLGGAGPDLDAYLDQFDVPSSRGIMQASLLSEAGEWIRNGIAIGYFSAETPPLPLIFVGVNFLEFSGLARYLADLHGQFFSREEPYYQRSPQLFPKELARATERLDYSDGSLELARLLHFAPEPEWERQLGLAAKLASTIRRRPDAIFPAGFLDEVRWVLFEDDHSPSSLENPSYWRRNTGLRPRISGRIGVRVAALASVRRQILAAAEHIASDEGTSAALQLAAELKNDRGHEDYVGSEEDDTTLFYRPRPEEGPQLWWGWWSTDS